MALPLSRILSRNFHLSSRRYALSRFAMPAMSPTMTEGGIAQWKKKEGESYSAGDVLLEIETDKATIDVEAQEDGVVAKIIAQDGSKNISVGTPIAILGDPGDDLSNADKMAAESSHEKSKSQEPTERKSEAPPPEPTSPPAKGQDTQTRAPPKDLPPRGEVIFASPIAKKIALERGIPLSKVKGTGPNGRIIREDLEKFKAGPAADSQTIPDYVDTPLSNMRRTIGSRLVKSVQENPHYYLTVDVDMSKTLKLREVFNQALVQKDPSAKLSVNDFVVKAVACALSDVPEANSAWLGEAIRQYKKADICIAVATPTGLITPIVKDVGSKGLTTISTEAKSLAKKARDGKLTPQEYQGGTFTVSNLGMYDISHFTAIINPPQSCILAIGSTKDTLVPAPDEERGFKVIPIMKVTMSSDHRVVDGALGARWLAAFKGYLENPLTFML